MEYVDRDDINDFASILNILGDPIRLKIVVDLMDHDCSVTGLMQHVNISQPLVSHHLRILRDAKIVKATKLGKQVIYSLVNETSKNIVTLLSKEVTTNVRS